ncbi:MAG: hypothetical protein Q9200_003491 [Gallowayella weberi]
MPIPIPPISWDPPIAEVAVGIMLIWLAVVPIDMTPIVELEGILISMTIATMQIDDVVNGVTVWLNRTMVIGPLMPSR